MLPRTRTMFWLLIMAWWCAAPFVESAFYTEELRRGAYSPNADSISIPLFWHLTGWLITAPFVFAFLYRASRPFPQKYSLFAFNRNLLPLGIVAWLAASSFIASELWFMWRSFASEHFFDVAYGFLECYVTVVVNALLQAKSCWWKPSNSAFEKDAPKAARPSI
jgi:hypothetical protein